MWKRCLYDLISESINIFVVFVFWVVEKSKSEGWVVAFLFSYTSAIEKTPAVNFCVKAPLAQWDLLISMWIQFVSKFDSMAEKDLTDKPTLYQHINDMTDAAKNINQYQCLRMSLQTCLWTPLAFQAAVAEELRTSKMATRRCAVPLHLFTEKYN